MLKHQLIQRLARAGLLSDPRRADMWLRHRVDHNTRRSLISELFSADAEAVA